MTEVRKTVNVAALTLQNAQLVRYNRGHITTITDRRGLEEFSCECYEALMTPMNTDLISILRTS